MQELRREKTVIKAHERVGAVDSVSDLIKTDFYKCLKVVVDIYEGSLNAKPYKLEFYCYDKEVINDASKLKQGDYVQVRYRTRSKRNKNTGMFYTNNVCYKINPITKDYLLIFNSKEDE